MAIASAVRDSADCALAETHWKSAEEIKAIEVYEDHLKRFPNCRFAGLARITQRVSVMTGSGEQQNEWAGPLLWDVLGASGVIEGADQREQAHLVVRVTGADGYPAVVSLGEISPLLANRPILLADQLNGALLPGHALRLIVPGDRLGARSVRDVVRIEIQ